MSATKEVEAVEGQETKRKVFTNIILGIGIAFAVFTLASGISSWFWPREDESEVTRRAFEGIPGVIFWPFYITVPLMIILGSIMFANRTRNWERGKPDNRSTT